MKKPIVLFIELKISAKNKYICDITEKLFHNDIPVSIYTKNSSSQIDGLLWTWKQESFVPHKVFNLESADSLEPVTIFDNPDMLPGRDALILGEPLPVEELQKYKLIIDFAEIYHSEKKAESRLRYKKMRDSDIFDIHFTQLGAILARKSISLN